MPTLIPRLRPPGGYGPFVVAMLVGALVLVGCGGSGDSTHATTKSGTPQRGGTFTIGIQGGGAATDTLDPPRWIDSIDILRISALYNTLTAPGPGGRPVMSLATSLTPNHTGTEWTIHLRPGVRFSDGTPFTAKDVLYTWRRVLRVKIDGILDYGNINLARTTAPGPLTIRAVLHAPDFNFPEEMSDIAGAVVKPGDNFNHPVGTGPFKFVSWTPGGTSIFTRNPYYWRRGHPYLDTLKIDEINNPASAVDALQSHQIDALWSVPFASVGTLKQSGFQIVNAPGQAAGAFYMRLDVPPFNNPLVRQAMKLAIDRKQCVQSGLDGYGEVGNDLFGRSSPSYARDISQREYNPTEAKALLARAGYSGDKRLTVTLDTAEADPGMVECAQVFKQSAARAGVTINIHLLPSAGALFDPAAGYLKFDFGMTIAGGNSFETQAASSLLCGAPFNETHMCDKTFDDLFAEARATRNVAQRNAIYARAQRLLWNNGGYIVWGYRDTLTAFAPNVHGLQEFQRPITVTYLPSAEDVWLSR
jgi:peptide/nickel transport system substrate-binding protein